MNGIVMGSLTKEADGLHLPVRAQLMVKYRETWKSSQEQNTNYFFNVLFAERIKDSIYDTDEVRYLTAKVRVEKRVFDSTNILDYLQIYC